MHWSYKEHGMDWSHRIGQRKSPYDIFKIVEKDLIQEIRSLKE